MHFKECLLISIHSHSPYIALHSSVFQFVCFSSTFVTSDFQLLLEQFVCVFFSVACSASHIIVISVVTILVLFAFALLCFFCPSLGFSVNHARMFCHKTQLMSKSESDSIFVEGLPVKINCLENLKITRNLLTVKPLLQLQ